MGEAMKMVQALRARRGAALQKIGASEGDSSAESALVMACVQVVQATSGQGEFRTPAITLDPALTFSPLKLLLAACMSSRAREAVPSTVAAMDLAAPAEPWIKFHAHPRGQGATLLAQIRTDPRWI